LLFPSERDDHFSDEDTITEAILFGLCETVCLPDSRGLLFKRFFWGFVFCCELFLMNRTVIEILLNKSKM
jgi:hypothetical protein